MYLYKTGFIIILKIKKIIVMIKFQKILIDIIIIAVPYGSSS